MPFLVSSLSIGLVDQGGLHAYLPTGMLHSMIMGLPSEI